MGSFGSRQGWGSQGLGFRARRSFYNKVCACFTLRLRVANIVQTVSGLVPEGSKYAVSLYAFGVVTSETIRQEAMYTRAFSDLCSMGPEAQHPFRDPRIGVHRAATADRQGIQRVL